MEDRAPRYSAAPSSRAHRRALLAAVSAEVGHELQGPLNLFRLVKERLGRGDALGAEDVALLGEELERLARLGRRLREMTSGSREQNVSAPAELIEAALRSPCPHPAATALELELEASTALGIRCDALLLSQALRELIDNALEARGARAGVRFRADAPAGFCIWDDGPGLELPPARAFEWGLTTRSGAAGVGLTLALRAARVHGFGLELRREASRTEAWLTLPQSALSPAAAPR